MLTDVITDMDRATSRADYADLAISTLGRLPAGRAHVILFPRTDSAFWMEHIYATLSTAITTRRPAPDFFISKIERTHLRECLSFGIHIERHAKSV